MGLAGLGDLVLTCTDDQSRNRRLGLALGRGLDLAAAQAQIRQVVEGVFAARAVCAVADRMAVEMPICREVFRIMHEAKPVREAVMDLMTRNQRAESD
jgi:glycerol-3-phosphate dehydrogenase (NAD(P)+)